jgi:hypothetical protein
MALNTYAFAKSVALTDYMPPFRQAKEQVTWPWEKIVTKKKTNRATEQVFSYTGLPAANQTGELEPIYYADAAELAATTFTVTKKTLATMFSHEFLQDSWHLPDMMAESGKMAGESQAYIRRPSCMVRLPQPLRTTARICVTATPCTMVEPMTMIWVRRQLLLTTCGS